MRCYDMYRKSTSVVDPPDSSCLAREQLPVFPLEWMLVENIRKRKSLQLSKKGWETL